MRYCLDLDFYPTLQDWWYRTILKIFLAPNQSYFLFIRIFPPVSFDITVFWQELLDIYYHFHNILRLFDVLPNFPFPTSKTIRDYYL